MKQFARITSLVLAVLMLVACLTACGEPANDPDTSGESTVSKEYVIYSDNSFAPFEFYDTATGKYIGVDMELFAAIAEDQGIVYTMKNEGFDASMGAVQSGQADGMIAGMTINDKRKETFDFSDGYFEDGQILVTKPDSTVTGFADLAGLTVAAKTSTVSATYTAEMAEQYGFEVVYYEDSPTMYSAVMNGTNAACVEDFSVIGWAIKNDGVALQTIGEVLNPGYYGFAVQKGQNADLLAKFNAGLANIKASGKYEEILAKYGY